MKIMEVIAALPILQILIIVVIMLLLVPISLRIAGLTGQQIVDVVTMTTKFLIELVDEFRNENKSKS